MPSKFCPQGDAWRGHGILRFQSFKNLTTRQPFSRNTLLMDKNRRHMSQESTNLTQREIKEVLTLMTEKKKKAAAVCCVTELAEELAVQKEQGQGRKCY